MPNKANVRYHLGGSICCGTAEHQIIQHEVRRSYMNGTTKLYTHPGSIRNVSSRDGEKDEPPPRIPRNATSLSTRRDLQTRIYSTERRGVARKTVDMGKSDTPAASRCLPSLLVLARHIGPCLHYSRADREDPSGQLALEMPFKPFAHVTCIALWDYWQGTPPLSATDQFVSPSLRNGTCRPPGSPELGRKGSKARR
jgi:hypothetical protein